MNKWGQEQVIPTRHIAGLFFGVKLRKWYNWVHFGIDITKKLDKNRLKQIKEKWRSKFPATFVDWIKYFCDAQLFVTQINSFKKYPGADYITPVSSIKRARFFYLFTKFFRPEKNLEKTDFLNQIKKVKKNVEFYRVWWFVVLTLSFFVPLFSAVFLGVTTVFEFFSIPWIILLTLAAFLWTTFIFSCFVLYGIYTTVCFSIFNLPNEITNLFFPKYHGKIYNWRSGEQPSGLLEKRRWWTSSEGVFFNLLPTNKKLWRYVILHIDLILCSHKKIKLINEVSEKYKNFSYKSIKADDNNITSWVYKEEPSIEEQVGLVF